MGISLSKKPIKDRFPEVLKTPRQSLPIKYLIEKEGFIYVAYKKNSAGSWYSFKNKYGIRIEFDSFKKAKDYIKDAQTYFSVSRDHELIEVDENGHIIVDN